MLSVVMPAFNEAGFLEESIRDVTTGLRARGEPFEVLVVENGSTDGTLDLAHRLAAADDSVRTLQRPVADYGDALRAGLLDARGDVVVNFDVDYYDLTFLSEAVERVRAPGGPSIVVASKRSEGATDERPLRRRIVTMTFGMLLRAGFGLGVSDTHGMKAMRRADVESLAEQCRFGVDLFDTELVLRAERAGLAVAELPAHVEERRPARTPIWTRVPRTMWGLVRLRVAIKGWRPPRPPASGSNGHAGSSGAGSSGAAGSGTGRASGSVTTVLRADGASLAGLDGPGPGWVAIDGELVVDRGTGDAARGRGRPGRDGPRARLRRPPGQRSRPCRSGDRPTRGDRRARVPSGGAGRHRVLPDDHEPRAGRLRAVARARRRGARLAGNGATPAAAILGAHLEGPFLGGAPGAHDPALIRPGDLEWTARTARRAPGRDRDGHPRTRSRPARRARRGCSSARGVCVALGHSRATFEQASAAAAAGATVVTHLFNGMGSLHHREPGLAGAALADPRLTPTIIADCVHVHPAVLQRGLRGQAGGRDRQRHRGDAARAGHRRRPRGRRCRSAARRYPRGLDHAARCAASRTSSRSGCRCRARSRWRPRSRPASSAPRSWPARRRRPRRSGRAGPARRVGARGLVRRPVGRPVASTGARFRRCPASRCS